jgi:hypothetical protein
MSRLSGHAADYLALRRALGFKLEKEGRLLPDFAAFAEAAGAGTVTVDLAVRWAAMPAGASPVWAAQRLSMLRGFARYLQTVEPAAQVPPAGLLPARNRRVTPYIYSDADIAALMAAARTLRNPLKAATFETLCQRASGVRPGWRRRSRAPAAGPADLGSGQDRGRERSHDCYRGEGSAVWPPTAYSGAVGCVMGGCLVRQRERGMGDVQGLPFRTVLCAKWDVRFGGRGPARAGGDCQAGVSRVDEWVGS